MNDLQKELFALAEPNYKAFSAKLLPNVDRDRILGIRLPKLRAVAKRIARGNWKKYFQESHFYFEEIMLKGMIIGYLSEPAEVLLPLVWEFLPEIDNWSVCDSFVSSLKLAKRDPESFLSLMEKCVQDGHPYHLRFVLVMLLTYYTAPEYNKIAFGLLDRISHTDYYVKMGKAWALSVFYFHAPQQVIRFLRDESDPFVYDMTLRKIIESNHCSPETKETIQQLRKSKR